MMLGMGYRPFEMMLQLLAKVATRSRVDAHTIITLISSAKAFRASYIKQRYRHAGNTYYWCSPRYTIQGKTKAIGLPYPARHYLLTGRRQCYEGEVSEAFQFAVLKQLPIIYWCRTMTGAYLPAVKNRALWMPMNLRQALKAWSGTGEWQ